MKRYEKKINEANKNNTNEIKWQENKGKTNNRRIEWDIKITKWGKTKQ